MPKPRYINMNRSGERERFALEMFTTFGITAFRLDKNGQVAWVKDANLGWLSADKWQLIRRLKSLLDSSMVERIVEGGYAINAALYNASVSALTVTVPVGKIVVIAAVGVLIGSLKAGDWDTALLILAGLIAPFGAILLMWMFAEWIEAFIRDGGAIELGENASWSPLTGFTLKSGGVEWNPIYGFLGPVFGSLFGSAGAPAGPAEAVSGVV